MRNQRSGKLGAEPIRLNIQTVAEAQAALDSHLHKRVPPHLPTASTSAHKLRAAWVDKRFQLESALRLAESAACKWETVYQAPEEPAPEPVHGSGAWQTPKTMSQRQAELREAEAMWHAMEAHSPEWLELREKIYGMRRRIAKARRAA